MDEEQMKKVLGAVIVAQGISGGVYHILLELTWRIAMTHPKPEEFVRTMFDSISARLDQPSPGDHRWAAGEERATIADFFSVLDRAVSRRGGA